MVNRVIRKTEDREVRSSTQIPERPNSILVEVLVLHRKPTFCSKTLLLVSWLARILGDSEEVQPLRSIWESSVLVIILKTNHGGTSAYVSPHRRQ